MARDLPAPLEAEIDARALRPFVALFIDLPDTVRAWSGLRQLEFADSGGVTRQWTNGAGLGALEAIGEATDGSATGMKATLFEAPGEMRDDVADQAVKGSAFEVYVGAVKPSFAEVEGDGEVEAVKLVWKGRTDDYRITDAGAVLSVEVSAESRAIDQRRPAIKRFTDEWQKRHHPGCRFFEYVSQLAEVPILWAQAEQKAAVASGPGGAGGGSRFGMPARAASL
jgi:hypothetical protein